MASHLQPAQLYTFTASIKNTSSYTQHLHYHTTELLLGRRDFSYFFFFFICDEGILSRGATMRRVQRSHLSALLLQPGAAAFGSFGHQSLFASPSQLPACLVYRRSCLRCVRQPVGREAADTLWSSTVIVTASVTFSSCWRTSC